jgi:hypothetical protein
MLKMTKADELQAVLDAFQRTFENCKKQNEKLIKLARFYGDPRVCQYDGTQKCWRPIVEDCGARARDILKEAGL